MGESSQEDLFATIEAERDLALQAIAARSPETNDLFERGYALFKMDLAESGQETWVAQSGLTRDQVGVVQEYLFTKAFMSAYWHSISDKARRDETAESASALVSGLGLDARGVFTQFLDHESIWKQAIRQDGGLSGRGAGCAGVLLAFWVGSAAALWILAA